MLQESSPSLPHRIERALAGLQLGLGRDYIGEPVSQLEHALQCAALARAARAPAHEVLAALFHDIGHLIAPAGSAEMAGLGIVDHEGLGAAWLRALGFDPRVCALVVQGGPMREDEAQRFEADPLFAAKVRVRSWDEAAKQPGKKVPELDSYIDLIREHLEQ